MRNILPLLVVGIFVLSGLGAVAGTNIQSEKSISETIVFSQPIITEKNDYVNIVLAEATSNSWEKDKPMLPIVTKVYTFPFGTSIDNVDVAFSSIVEKKISKPIEPSPEVQIIGMTVSNNAEEQDVIMTYSDISIYPENRYSYKIAGGIRNEENIVYLILSLYPDQYIPNKNILLHANNVKINVKYNLPEKPVIFPDEYDFLILTPNEFTTPLLQLVIYKNSLNNPIKTKMVTLSEIPNLGGVDQQENIKLYIRQAKETWGIDYVMLVGAGVEGKEIFPVRNAVIPDSPYEDFFPSDLYYADIYDGVGGFPDWDKDNDGKYAEYPADKLNMDILPDVYISRIACNDASEVKTVVDKFILYNDHNKMTKKILQIGGDTFTNDPQIEGEYANSVVLTKLPGYSTTQLWASKGNLKKTTIAEGYRSKVDFIDYSGHGSYMSWATHPPGDEHTWVPPKEVISPYTGWLYIDFDLFLVNNGKKFPVVVYNACSNNKFSDSEECLGWKTLSKTGGGGIASYAAAGIGYGSPGHEVERVMGWMEVHSFEELYSTKVMGQVWGNCISDYFTTFQSELDREDYKTLCEFCMFGDPTLSAQNGIDPDPRPIIDHPLFNMLFERLIDYFPILAKLQ